MQYTSKLLSLCACLILLPWAWLFIKELLGWLWPLCCSSHCPLSSSVLFKVRIALGLSGYLLSSSHWESGPASCTLKLATKLVGCWCDPLPTVCHLILCCCVTPITSLSITVKGPHLDFPLQRPFGHSPSAVSHLNFPRVITRWGYSEFSSCLNSCTSYRLWFPFLWN